MSVLQCEISAPDLFSTPVWCTTSAGFSQMTLSLSRLLFSLFVFWLYFCNSCPKSLSFSIKLHLSQDDDLNILIMLTVWKSEEWRKDCIQLRAQLLKCNTWTIKNHQAPYSFLSQCLNTVTHLPIHTCLCPHDDTFVRELSGTTKMS